MSSVLRNREDTTSYVVETNVGWGTHCRHSKEKNCLKTYACLMRNMKSQVVLQNVHLSCKSLTSSSLGPHEVKRKWFFFPVEHRIIVFPFMVSIIFCLLIIKYLQMLIACWKISMETWAEVIQELRMLSTSYSWYHWDPENTIGGALGNSKQKIGRETRGKHHDSKKNNACEKQI